MGLNNNHLPIIFAPLENYGYRGNHALWQMMQETLSSTSFAMTAEQLVAWAVQFTQQQIVNSLWQEKIEQNINGTKWYFTRFTEADWIDCDESLHGDSEAMNAFLFESLNNCIGSLLSDKQATGYIRVNAFNRGGMSGGGFALDNWHTIMLPTLCARARQLEAGLVFTEKHQCKTLHFIGDLHGRADKLDALLTGLGERADHQKLVFVGDLVDNYSDEKTEHLALLHRVKNKVERGEAFCLLGNHELNAIGLFMRKESGEPCRPHTEKNRKQHLQFLEQVKEGSAVHKEWIEWFKTLPLYLNFGSVVAIHACWHQPSIDKLTPYLNDDNSLKSEHWQNAFDDNHDLCHLLTTLLKGPEASLPEGHYFFDRNGIKRNVARIAWWKDNIASYNELFVGINPNATEIPAMCIGHDVAHYNAKPCVPVVIGHYSLPMEDKPRKIASRVACVDLKAANQKSVLASLSVTVDTWPENLDNVLDDEMFYVV